MFLSQQSRCALMTNVNIDENEDKILESISARQTDMVSTLKTWSEINSGSHNMQGLRAMRKRLISAFNVLPGEIKEIGLVPGKYVEANGQISLSEYEPSLGVCVRKDAPIQIVLTGHYDTVFPKDSHFQTTTELAQDVLGGPGVADMKGGILVMLEALKAFEHHPDAHKVGYTVLLSPDEEIGSPGSGPILTQLGQQAHIGLTYEPSMADGSLAGARKGSGNFALTIHGRAAHAGREHHLGRNAIVAMAKFATALDELNGKREGVTFNFAKLDGGGAVNIVPDIAVGRFNVRMLMDEDMVWIDTQIRRLVDEINQADGLSAELSGGFTRPPKPMAPANALVFDWVKRAGGALGQDIRWVMSGGVCEGNNLWASGCPNVDTLGVIGGEIHSDREYVNLPSLSERARLSALILMKIASGEFDAKQAKNMAITQE